MKLTEIGDQDRVDVILTNPPFGGEEETRHPGQFPRGQADRRNGAAVPAAHHAQAAAAGRGGKPGRAGVVVPNGTLFGDGVCARIKEELLKEFNLHTIVRLPNGVFAPYTSIPTNLLFFDRSGPTREVWYYEQPLPEGRKKYTKTAAAPVRGVRRLPGMVEEAQGERAGLEGARPPICSPPAATSTARTPAPRRTSNICRRSSWSKSILAKEQRIAAIMGEIKELLAGGAR